MIFNNDTTEYHHLRIKTISKEGSYNVPRIVLSCVGSAIIYDKNALNSRRKLDYRVVVRCWDYLAEYARSELEINDEIFVVGTTGHMKGNIMSTRVVDAKYIYKEEWYKYCPR